MDLPVIMGTSHSCGKIINSAESIRPEKYPWIAILNKIHRSFRVRSGGRDTDTYVHPLTRIVRSLYTPILPT